jgi:hypothetical protein
MSFLVIYLKICQPQSMSSKELEDNSNGNYLKIDACIELAF